MSNRRLLESLLIGLSAGTLTMAQLARDRDVVPLNNWPTPLYFQPTQAETDVSEATAGVSRLEPRATSPAGALVFVAMTPCRVVDTRVGQGFTGAFGPPSLTGGVSRTFPIRSSTTCSVPAIAQAYSFNVTVVPHGVLGFLTVYPTGQTRPNASTLNDDPGVVIANAAIVPAGTSGSIDVYALQSTELVMDINGYYAPQTGLTLAQGSAGAPSLSFGNDAGTGIYSSGAGTVNIATGGQNRLGVRSDGDIDLTGDIRKYGSLFLHSRGEANTGIGNSALATNTGKHNTAAGAAALSHNTDGSENTAAGDRSLWLNTTGSYNTAVGTGALFYNTAGNNNTAVGKDALVNVLGSNNIGLGISAGVVITGSNNIEIGNRGLPSDDHIIRIGDVQTKTYIAGISGVKTGSGAVPVWVDSNGQLGSGAFTCTTVVQNFVGTVDLVCPNGYVAVAAACSTIPVINDASLNPPGTTWRQYLTPNSSAATGVHCDVGGGSSQVNLRCCK